MHRPECAGATFGGLCRRRCGAVPALGRTGRLDLVFRKDRFNDISCCRLLPGKKAVASKAPIKQLIGCVPATFAQTSSLVSW